MVQFIDRPKTSGQRLYEGFLSGAEQVPTIAKNLKAYKEEERRKSISDQLRKGVGTSSTPGSNQPSSEDQALTARKEELFREVMQKMPGQEGEFTEKDAAQQESSLGKQLWEEINPSKPVPLQDDMKKEESEHERRADLYREIGDEDKAKAEEERAKGARKERTDKEERSFKSNEPIYKQAQEDARTTKQNQQRLDRLGVLENSGKLDPPGSIAFEFDEEGRVRAISTIAGMQPSPETTEYIKIVNDFMKGATQTFGGQVRVWEAQQYMKTLPDLMQSEDGRRAVLRDLSLMNAQNISYAEAIKGVGNDYGLNISPEKFHSEIERRVGDIEQALMDEYVNPTLPYKQLSNDKMLQFIESAPGETKQEKVENAKLMARQQGYFTD